MKRISLLLISSLILTQINCAQVQSDAFVVPVYPKGDLAGTHFYIENSQGPLVLFSSGYNQYQDAFFNIATRLASKGYHIVTFDLRGHGKSTALLTDEKDSKDKDTVNNPIYDQATHEGLRLNHWKDLDAIYKYALDLPGVKAEQTILGLSGDSVPIWSFNMISNHPELKKFIFLGNWLGTSGEKYFSENSGFNILMILTEAEGHVNAKRIKNGADKVKNYFAQNKNHKVEEVVCKSGIKNEILEKCSIAEQKIIDWIEKISKN